MREYNGRVWLVTRLPRSTVTAKRGSTSDICTEMLKYKCNWPDDITDRLGPLLNKWSNNVADSRFLFQRRHDKKICLQITDAGDFPKVLHLINNLRRRLILRFFAKDDQMEHSAMEFPLYKFVSFLLLSTIYYAELIYMTQCIENYLIIINTEISDKENWSSFLGILSNQIFSLPRVKHSWKLFCWLLLIISEKITVSIEISGEFSHRVCFLLDNPCLRAPDVKVLDLNFIVYIYICGFISWLCIWKHCGYAVISGGGMHAYIWCPLHDSILLLLIAKVDTSCVFPLCLLHISS